MIDNTHVVVASGRGAQMVPAAAFAERFGFVFRAHAKGDANRSALRADPAVQASASRQGDKSFTRGPLRQAVALLRSSAIRSSEGRRQDPSRLQQSTGRGQDG